MNTQQIKVIVDVSVNCSKLAQLNEARNRMGRASRDARAEVVDRVLDVFGPLCEIAEAVKVQAE